MHGASCGHYRMPLTNGIVRWEDRQLNQKNEAHPLTQGELANLPHRTRRQLAKQMKNRGPRPKPLGGYNKMTTF